MSSKKRVSLVIPAYQEEQNIPLVYQEIIRTLKNISETYDFEILFVNDGSLDGTWNEITQLCQLDDRVKGINLSRNFGKELALTAGLEYASGDAVITLDADGQHPAEQIPNFIQKWQE